MTFRTAYLAAIILILGFVNYSCTPANQLLYGLTKKQGTLHYSLDSDREIVKRKETILVARPTVSDPNFKHLSSVKMVKGSALPLLIYTGWKAEYEYRVGRASIRDDIQGFVQSSLIKESRRSGTFAADTIRKLSGLKLEIQIDSMGAFGKYHQKGYFVFLGGVFFYKQQEHAGPAVSYSRFSYKLSRGDKVLLEGYTSANQPIEFSETTYKKLNELRSSYNGKIVEALARTFKANIERIVGEIDIFLDNNQDRLDGS